MKIFSFFTVVFISVQRLEMRRKSIKVVMFRDNVERLKKTIFRDKSCNIQRCLEIKIITFSDKSRNI